MPNTSPDFSQKYKIHQEFAHDFISHSYLASNNSENNFVEAKFLSPDLLNGEDTTQRLDLTTEIYKEFKHHNITRFIEVARTENNEPAFISEYNNGYTLDFLFDYFIRTNTKIPIHLASFIITEICTGLDYIHSRRSQKDSLAPDSVFHGLSAENIFISLEGKIKIRGVELSPIRYQYIDKKQELHKSLFYSRLAPEYSDSNAVVDFRADLYALGILFLEFLSGQRFNPVSAPASQINSVFELNSDYFDNRPKEATDRLRTILYTILAENPDERYSATNQLYMDLLHQLILTASNANFTDELAAFIQLVDGDSAIASISLDENESVGVNPAMRAAIETYESTGEQSENEISEPATSIEEPDEISPSKDEDAAEELISPESTTKFRGEEDSQKQSSKLAAEIDENEADEMAQTKNEAATKFELSKSAESDSRDSAADEEKITQDQPQSVSEADAKINNEALTYLQNLIQKRDPKPSLPDFEDSPAPDIHHQGEDEDSENCEPTGAVDAQSDSSEEEQAQADVDLNDTDSVEIKTPQAEHILSEDIDESTTDAIDYLISEDYVEITEQTPADELESEAEPGENSVETTEIPQQNHPEEEYVEVLLDNDSQLETGEFRSEIINSDDLDSDESSEDIATPMAGDDTEEISRESNYTEEENQTEIDVSPPESREEQEPEDSNVADHVLIATADDEAISADAAPAGEPNSASKSITDSESENFVDDAIPESTEQEEALTTDDATIPNSDTEVEPVQISPENAEEAQLNDKLSKNTVVAEDEIAESTVTEPREESVEKIDQGQNGRLPKDNENINHVFAGNESEETDAPAKRDETNPVEEESDEIVSHFQNEEPIFERESIIPDNAPSEYEAIFDIDTSLEEKTDFSEALNEKSRLDDQPDNISQPENLVDDPVIKNESESFFNLDDENSPSPKSSINQQDPKNESDPAGTAQTEDAGKEQPINKETDAKKSGLFSFLNPFGRSKNTKKENLFFKIIDNSNNTAKSESASRFYSIIDDAGAGRQPIDGEEVKTIIDVVRLSARSNPKAFIIGGAMIPLLFIVFTVVDTFGQFTSYGTGIYDYFFPPAIRIETVPSGAQVYLDDKPLPNKTPLQLAKIDPGVHKLKLTLPKFDPITKSFNVLGKGELHVTGEKERHGSIPYIFKFKVQLELSSQPSGATVYIDDIKISEKAPTTVHWEISDKPISIRMEKGNYPTVAGLMFDAHKDVESISDKRFWRFQRLNKMKHHIAVEGVFRKEIKIDSVPSRAEIYVDEGTASSGITGINGTLLFTEGEHIITLRKPGYIPQRFNLSITDTSSNFLRESLSRYVTISSQDFENYDETDIKATVVQIIGQGKTIEINKTTPVQVRLLPYTYTAVIRKNNYEDKTVKIFPRDMHVVAKMIPTPTDASITVFDVQTKQIIPDATILYNTRRSLDNAINLGTTDYEGKIVSQVPDGYFSVFASKEGYRLTMKGIHFKKGKRNRVVLRMRKQY